MKGQWTVKQLATAFDLWHNSDKSAAQIGAVIKKSRSSVIGMADRKGWVTRGQTSRVSKILTPEVIKESNRAALKAVLAQRVAEAKIKAEEARKAEADRKRQAALDRAQKAAERGLLHLCDVDTPLNGIPSVCLFIIGEPRRGRICGLETNGHGPYCKGHTAVCTRPSVVFRDIPVEPAQARCCGAHCQL